MSASRVECALTRVVQLLRCTEETHETVADELVDGALMGMHCFDHLVEVLIQ